MEGGGVGFRGKHIDDWQYGYSIDVLFLPHKKSL